jgi:hypothetical protein
VSATGCEEMSMNAFEIVLFVVCAGSAIIAVAAFLGARRLYDEIGRMGSLWMAREDNLSDETRELVRQEVQQTVEAIQAARQRRSQAPAGGAAESR